MLRKPKKGDARFYSDYFNDPKAIKYTSFNMKENLASRHLLEKFGFKQEGVINGGIHANLPEGCRIQPECWYVEHIQDATLDQPHGALTNNFRPLKMQDSMLKYIKLAHYLLKEINNSKEDKVKKNSLWM